MTLADGREFPGRYLGGEEPYDLAFLKIDAGRDPLPVAPLDSALADRCRPCDPGVEGWCEDFDDDALWLDFTLARGAFATSVLRELAGIQSARSNT